MREGTAILFAIERMLVIYNVQRAFVLLGLSTC